MAFKKLSAPPAQETVSEPTSTTPAPTAEAALAAALRADPTAPPVRAKQTAPADPPTGMHFRFRTSTAISLEQFAFKRGVSMKVIVAEALKAYGVKVAPRDLQDMTPKRRRSL